MLLISLNQHNLFFPQHASVDHAALSSCFIYSKQCGILLLRWGFHVLYTSVQPFPLTISQTEVLIWSMFVRKKMCQMPLSESAYSVMQKAWVNKETTFVISVWVGFGVLSSQQLQRKPGYLGDHATAAMSIFIFSPLKCSLDRDYFETVFKGCGG